MLVVVVVACNTRTQTTMALSVPQNTKPPHTLSFRQRHAKCHRTSSQHPHAASSTITIPLKSVVPESVPPSTTSSSDEENPHLRTPPPASGLQLPPSSPLSSQRNRLLPDFHNALPAPKAPIKIPPAIQLLDPSLFCKLSGSLFGSLTIPCPPHEFSSRRRKNSHWLAEFDSFRSMMARREYLLLNIPPRLFTRHSLCIQLLFFMKKLEALHQ